MLSCLALALLILFRKRMKPWQFIGGGLLLCCGSGFLAFIRHWNWALIQKLDAHRPIAVIIAPLRPRWEVNLVARDTVLSDPGTLNLLTDALKSYRAFTLGNKESIWSARVRIVFPGHDTVNLHVDQSEYAGTIVTDKTGMVRADELGEQLARITRNRAPVYGDVPLKQRNQQEDLPQL